MDAAYVCSCSCKNFDLFETYFKYSIHIRFVRIEIILARDPAEIERSNLMNICKLVVKELLEQSLHYGRMLDSDHLPLQHFFIIIEHVLGHGLRIKKVSSML